MERVAMTGLDSAHAEALPSIVLFVGRQAGTIAPYAAFFEASGLWVASASDPTEALAAVQELKPDLVIIDEFDEAELDFIDALKSSPDTRAIPVILLGRRPLSKVLREVREQPDVWLEKPVLPDALLERSRALIGQARALREAAPCEPARAVEIVPVPASREARRCPACAGPLEWIERGRLYGIEYDYYRWCQKGCGLYCYDCSASAWVKLA
jgi:CheY-like chemotaxis protein